jgi:hypothetical protein
MPAIGFGIVWLGYALTSWGYCLVRGYPVSFSTWINPVHPYSGAWPPPGTIPQDEVFPGVTVGSAGEASDPSGTAQIQAGAKAAAPAASTSGGTAPVSDV